MDYFSGDYSEFCPLENLNVTDNANGVTNFTVDDLLDLSKDDDPMADAFFDNTAVNSDGSSTLTVVDSCNSSVSGGDGSQFNGNLSCSSFNDNQFSGNELCVPYDDLAELEWLSNFVEESFSNDDVHHFIPTTAAAYSSSSASAITSGAPSFFPAEVSVPGKARSKLSRAPPRDWSSRLLHLSPFSSSKTGPTKKKEPTEITGRKCLHCGSDKTPQWRTGPMGPKTLCNACGVRYKSGRLVPEYRPAASPSFVSSKHSNSHRKVMELRRQKDYQQHKHQQLLGQVSIFNRHNEFMIHHGGSFNGSDYSHMM